MERAGGERVGVLVLRIWIEPDDPPGTVRARITASRDVLRGERESIAAASPEQALELIRAWIDRFVAHQTGA